MTSRTTRRWSRGFTAVELMVAVVISMVVMAAAQRFFVYQLSSMRTERARRSAQMTVRTALNFMVRQLELLGRDPQRVLFSSLDDATLPPAIAAAGTDFIHYRTNLSQDLDDVDSQDQWEDVTFTLSAGTIWVTQGAAAPVALTDGTATASHVAADGLELRYFDGFGDPVANLAGVADRARIRRIRVSLTVTGGPAAEGAGAPHVTLTQDVFLRNVS